MPGSAATQDATQELAKLSVEPVEGPSRAGAPDTPQRTPDSISELTHLNSPGDFYTQLLAQEASSPPAESIGHERRERGQRRPLASSSSPSGEEASKKGKGKAKAKAKETEKVVKKPRNLK
ncbi:hypothetical protein IMSHALPRED_007335 [Imshaugia aleurites]|uniref:Uncharacterized protein n=1 Tax=Imshaugia aleurites TaxID=172621 RepID=A0A8H3IU38_9LECA|nr:hypothetical protein IMSHALPRED_007335 [Imshaugia aleurites]